MSRETIQNRIAFLFTALQYCSNVKRCFSTGERIMINQERFQWTHILSYPLAEPRVVSFDIDLKLKNLEKSIADYDQENLNDNLYKNEF